MDRVHPSEFGTVSLEDEGIPHKRDVIYGASASPAWEIHKGFFGIIGQILGIP
jgi:hypothetical protein